MCVSVLFHDVCTIVVYVDAFGWESLSGSLSMSSIVQDEGTWRLGSLGGEVCGWNCSSGCIFRGVL